jgi:hypothetical protein
MIPSATLNLVELTYFITELLDSLTRSARQPPPPHEAPFPPSFSFRVAHIQNNLHAANQNAVGGLLLRRVPIVSLVSTYGKTL